MTRYTGTCGIMAMGLLYMLALWSNISILYWPWIKWLFVASAALMGGHYRMDIISSEGHPWSDSAMPLVLCTIVCNGWGTSIVLQVP